MLLVLVLGLGLPSASSLCWMQRLRLTALCCAQPVLLVLSQRCAVHSVFVLQRAATVLPQSCCPARLQPTFVFGVA